MCRSSLELATAIKNLLPSVSSAAVIRLKCVAWHTRQTHVTSLDGSMGSGMVWESRDKMPSRALSGVSWWMDLLYTDKCDG